MNIEYYPLQDTDLDNIDRSIFCFFKYKRLGFFSDTNKKWKKSKYYKVEISMANYSAKKILQSMINSALQDN